MARDRGTILFSLWGDDHWRELSVAAQHLYMQLETSPSLSYAGVADWRPGKLALAKDASYSERYDAALELQGSLFVIIDDETEEILVRSFLRHDGLLEKPNMVIALHKAFAQVASPTLRGVIVHELGRLQVEFPGWKAWSHPSCSASMSQMLKSRSIDPKELLITPPSGSGNSSLNPSDNPSSNPSNQGSSNSSGKDSKKNGSLQLQLQLPPSKEGEEPPSKCLTHIDDENPPACGACADARKANAAWVKLRRPTVSGIQTPAQCREHGYPAGQCPTCDIAVAS
jgi:ferredoxin